VWWGLCALPTATLWLWLFTLTPLSHTNTHKVAPLVDDAHAHSEEDVRAVPLARTSERTTPATPRVYRPEPRLHQPAYVTSK
jgi:hypothetical protein